MKALWPHVRLIVWNDLRLTQRYSTFGDHMNWALGLGLCILFHFLGIVACVTAGSAMTPANESLGWWIITFLMFGTSMNTAVGTLYERSDFDLLLSSPVSARAVLIARMASNVAASFISVAVFVPALLNPAIFILSPRYASGYLVWLMLAVVSASAGTTLMLGLVHVLGARQARVISQLIASALLCTALVGPQLISSLDGLFSAPWLQELSRNTATNPVFLVPGLAGRADPAALLLLAIATAAAVGLTVFLLSRTFVSGVQEVGDRVTRRRPSGTKHRWTEGLALATFRKEVRLIVRDPMLFARVLPQFAYILPLVVTAVRWMDVAGMIALATFMLAMPLSAALSYIAVAGEDCWDLVRMSPVSELLLRNAKIAAGMALPMLLTASAAVALVFLGHPLLAVITAILTFACSAGISRIGCADIQPAPRADIFRPKKHHAGGGFRTVFAMLYFMATGAGGLAGVAAGKVPLLTAILVALALAGAAASFYTVKFESVLWTDRARSA